jgi:uncharacterized GH25 family protein
VAINKNTMKKLIVFIVIFLSSCVETEDNGFVLVSIIHDEKPLSHATVYFKQGIDTSLNIATTKFDKVLKADANGQVHFRNLPQGNYTIYGSGYSSQKQDKVMGVSTLTITNRTRLNTYAVKIIAK